MASELSWRGLATGSTDYVTIRSVARQYWNTSGTPAFENLTVANWANYAIALTETPASSYFYVGSWPATLTTVGFYWVDVFRQLGGSAAISDMLLGTLLGYWDGTTFKPWADDLANWLGVLPLALSSQQVQAVVPSSTVVASVTGAVGSVTGNVGGNVTGSVGSVAGNVTGSVGSVTGNVGGNVVGSVASVTGNVGGNLVGNVNGNVVGSVGSVAGNVSGSVASVSGNVGGNVVGSVGSVVADVGITQTGADKVWNTAVRTLTSFGTLVADVTTAVWAAASRTLTAFGFSVTVGTNNDKTGYSLNLTQALDETATGATTGAALNAARAQGIGKWAIVGDTLTLYASDNTTVVKTFTLAPPGGPYTSRT